MNWTRKLGLDFDVQLATFINLSKKQVTNWLLENARNALTGNWIKWFMGLVITVTGCLTVLFLSNTQNALVSILIRIPLFFFCGTSLYSFVYGLTIPARLKHLPIKIPLYQDNYTGVSSLNSILFTFTIISLAFYAVLFVAIRLGGYPSHYLMVTWLSSIGIIVIVILPNAIWGLHNVMKSAKRSALLNLSVHLETAIQENVQNPSQEKLDFVKSLFEFRNEIQKLPEWPIDMKTVFAGVAALALTILPTIIELVATK